MSWLIDDSVMLMEKGGGWYPARNSSVFLAPDRHRIQPDRAAEVHKSILPELSIKREFEQALRHR
jgi:hypothetical protein